MKNVLMILALIAIVAAVQSMPAGKCYEDKNTGQLWQTIFFHEITFIKTA